MKKGIGIVLGVFALVAALITGIVIGNYLDANKNSNNDNSEVVNKKNEEKELDVNSTIVTTLADGVMNAGFTRNTINDEYLQYIYKHDKLVLADAPLTFKLTLVARNFDLNNSSYDKNGDLWDRGYVYESDLKDAYEKVFGIDSYKAGEYFYPQSGNVCDKFYYNSSTKMYELDAYSCGTGSDMFNLTKVTKAVEKSNRIELYENVLFCEGVTCYSDVEEKNKIGEIEAIGISNQEDSFKEKNIDKGTQYKYTFMKNNHDQYVFTSIEKVK